MRLVALLICYLACCMSLAAQSLATHHQLRKRIDSVVHQAASTYMAHPNTVGLSIGIYRDGLLYNYHYGEVKKGSGQLPTVHTFYNVGSVAKTFVGVALAQTVIDRKANLEDDIRRYLPGSYPNLSYRAHPVRLIHLANHTSGLPPSPKIFPAALRDSLSRLDLVSQVNFHGQYTQDSLLGDLHQVKVDTVPGTAHRYNSSAMMVLSLLLERIHGQSYEHLFAHYLQTHLGMYDTKVQLSSRDQERVAQGYNAQGQARPYVNLKGFYLGPSMNSTVSDMLKYIRANLLEEDPALKLSHRLTWGKPNGFGLGLGWMLDWEDLRARRIYHSGSTGIGFNTLCSIYPDHRTGIVIFANETTSQDRVAALERSIAEGLR